MSGHTDPPPDGMEEPGDNTRIKGAMVPVSLTSTVAATVTARGDAAGLLPPASPPPDEAAFDLWLRRELTRLYDDALHEPVPEELLRLLRGGGG